MDETKKRAKKLKLVSELEKLSEVKLLKHIDSVAEELEKKDAEIEKKLEEKLAEVKDSFPTFEEVVKAIEIPEPIKGEVGEQGIQGIQGDKGEKGDTTIVEKVIEKTEVIRETPIVTENIVEKAVTDEPIIIADKLNTLKEVINSDVIKGFKDLERITKENVAHQLYTGVTETRVKELISKLPSSGGGTWGSITGTITAQTDLTTYLSSNYYPLSANPAGYTTLSAVAGVGYLTSIAGLTADNSLLLQGHNAAYFQIAGSYQPLATNLTSLAGLTYASASFVKMTAAGTFALDTNTYLTSLVVGTKGDILTFTTVPFALGVGTDGYVLSADHTTASGLKWVANSGSGITGSGNANEIAYFTAGTVLGSLAVASYPSLTELAYVKGVTSAIQTQLNAKQATLTNPITGTGTTNEISYWASASTQGTLPVATYPSLTQLSYVKGVTSAIQTQLGNKIGGTGVLGYVPYFTSTGSIAISGMTWLSLANRFSISKGSFAVTDLSGNPLLYASNDSVGNPAVGIGVDPSTYNGESLVVSNGIYVTGWNAGILMYDRTGDSNGYGVFYRNAHVTSFYDSVYGDVFSWTESGNAGIANNNPTARLHLPAGSATASTAPLKIDAGGTLLSTPEIGALEFTDDGTTGHLYITLHVAGVATRHLIF